MKGRETLGNLCPVFSLMAKNGVKRKFLKKLNFFRKNY